MKLTNTLELGEVKMTKKDKKLNIPESAIPRRDFLKKAGGVAAVTGAAGARILGGIFPA